MPEFLASQRVASTKATVLVKQNNPSVCWQLEQISVTVGTASTTGNVGIFKNGNMVTPTSALTPVVKPDGTSVIGQTAAGDPYLYLQASDEVEIVVSSVTNGDTVTVRIQYRELSLSDPLVRGM